MTPIFSALLLAAAAFAFPTVTGKNLNGTVFHLPSDFAAPVNLVFVPFVRNQQSDVDSWKPFVSDLKSRHPRLGVYEVPTLSSGYSLFRGFIDGGMRSGIPDPAVRATTITLYIDKHAFDSALGIESESAITVLLVRPNGEILWRAMGRYDAANPPKLDEFLRETT